MKKGMKRYDVKFSIDVDDRIDCWDLKERIMFDLGVGTMRHENILIKRNLIDAVFNSVIVVDHEKISNDLGGRDDED